MRLCGLAALHVCEVEKESYVLRDAPRRPPIFANGDPRVDRPLSPASRDGRGRRARYPDFDFLHAASEGGREGERRDGGELLRGYV